MCPPDAYSKKRICFFQVRFLPAFLFCFQTRERNAARFPLFPFDARWNTGIRLQQVRGSADDLLLRHSCRKKDLMIRHPRVNWYFLLVFRRTVSHAVFPGMLPGTLRSRHRSLVAVLQIDGPTAAITSFASVPNRSCIASSVACPILWTVPRQPECESPIARCTGSTK